MQRERIIEIRGLMIYHLLLMNHNREALKAEAILVTVTVIMEEVDNSMVVPSLFHN